jgi:hypothetical protein
VHRQCTDSAQTIWSKYGPGMEKSIRKQRGLIFGHLMIPSEQFAFIMS